MGDVIKINTGLTGPIPQRFNSVDDARLKRPKLFDYVLKCDTSVCPHQWTATGNIYLNGKIVKYCAYGFSKAGAQLLFLSKTPNMSIVH